MNVETVSNVETTTPSRPRTSRLLDRTATRSAAQKKERRRRIDPTTFEKQYTDDELEFMNAMQRFKELSGKTFPSYADVIRVAVSLGYRRAVFEFDPMMTPDSGVEPVLIIASSRDN